MGAGVCVCLILITHFVIFGSTQTRTRNTKQGVHWIALSNSTFQIPQTGAAIFIAYFWETSGAAFSARDFSFLLLLL